MAELVRLITCPRCGHDVDRHWPNTSQKVTTACVTCLADQHATTYNGRLGICDTSASFIWRSYLPAPVAVPVDDQTHDEEEGELAALAELLRLQVSSGHWWKARAVIAAGWVSPVTLAAAVKDAQAEAIAPVKALLACGPNSWRHYYAVDSTCQRCGMPSHVETALRAAVSAPGDPT